MSKAYKCDRCGKYWDISCAHIEKREYFNASSTKDKSYDLCPTCLSKFDEWINGERYEKSC